VRVRHAGLAGLGALAVACSASPKMVGFAGGGGTTGATGGTGGSGSNDAGITILPAAPSAGCGTATTQPLESYVELHLAISPDAIADAGITDAGAGDAGVSATDRLYYVRLPANYDPSKPYRVVYLGPGCNEPQDEQPNVSHVYAMQSASTDQAILIAMEPGLYNAAHYNSPTCGAQNPPTCQYCFDDGAYATTAGSLEFPYFDALHKQIEASYCVDKNREFYAGYSSGGWLAQELGCQFPDVLRAQGNTTGGLPAVIGNGTQSCKDHPIAAFLLHDFNDQSNPYSGSVAALNRLLVLNKCQGGQTMDTAPTAPYTIAGVPAANMVSCVQYTGCPADYPIVFCTSMGQAHNSQDTTAIPGFWQFFSMF
jgi:polyhydroxybutyrate depolymerase